LDQGKLGFAARVIEGGLPSQPDYFQTLFPAKSPGVPHAKKLQGAVNDPKQVKD